MEYSEYTRRLHALRVEYANAIKRLHDSGDYYMVIASAENSAAEYRLSVGRLIDEYQATKEH